MKKQNKTATTSKFHAISSFDYNELKWTKDSIDLADLYIDR